MYTKRARLECDRSWDSSPDGFKPKTIRVGVKQLSLTPFPMDSCCQRQNNKIAFLPQICQYEDFTEFITGITVLSYNRDFLL
jgi:hypothetical protein